jgi:hypothetical protein
MFLDTAASDGGSYNTLEAANPSPKCNLRTSADKQMDVIWHYNVASQPDAPPQAALTVLVKCSVS